MFLQDTTSENLLCKFLGTKGETSMKQRRQSVIDSKISLLTDLIYAGMMSAFLFMAKL